MNYVRAKITREGKILNNYRIIWHILPKSIFIFLLKLKNNLDYKVKY